MAVFRKLFQPIRLGHAAAKSTFVLLFLLCALPVSAHEVRPAVADVTVTASQARIEVILTLEPLVAGLDLAGLDDTNDSPLAARYDRLRALPPQDLTAEFRADWPQIAGKITLQAGDTALTPEITSVEVPPVGDVALPRDATLVLTAPLPPDGSPVVFGWDAAYGPLIVRQADVGDDGYAALLPDGGLSAPMPRIGTATVGALATFANYLVIGFEHIVPKGLDHILFVLGLFFFSLHMRPLLMQVTAFTLAHTVTLALATLGVVSVSAAIVEPLIAASIVYVAIENVFGGRISWRRTAVVFGFGLLHGLGFASVLGNIGLEPSRFLGSLISFNIGVELGQLAVIATAFATVGYWFGRKHWYRKAIAVPASALIASVGAYWSIERVFF
jgi:uncharacterized membrane protein